MCIRDSSNTWLGTGIHLSSNLDSLYVPYEAVVAGEPIELLCDFSGGPDFILGTVVDLDSIHWFSMNYIEAVDTLTISSANTVVALSMLMPALAVEDEEILNFVEENISGTTHYDSLVTALSSQIEGTGAMRLSPEDYQHLDQTATELNEELPDVGLMPSGCPGVGALLSEWPILSADEDLYAKKRLKYNHCGSELSYAVQAVSHLPGGGSRTSKTWVFAPQIGLVGDFLWKAMGESYAEYDSFEHALIPGSSNYRLTTADLRLDVFADASTAITVRTSSLPSLLGPVIQGPLPPFDPSHDLICNVVDAIVPVPTCGLSGMAGKFAELDQIYDASFLLSEEEGQELSLIHI